MENDYKTPHYAGENANEGDIFWVEQTHLVKYQNLGYKLAGSTRCNDKTKKIEVSFYGKKPALDKDYIAGITKSGKEAFHDNRNDGDEQEL